MPFAQDLIEHLTFYASLLQLSYPLINVRVVPSLLLSSSSECAVPYANIPPDKAPNLYQKIKKCIRQKVTFDHLLIPN